MPALRLIPFRRNSKIAGSLPLKVVQWKEQIDMAKEDSVKRGYFQIYTGNGKGKTTAALGIALRAAGHGLKTYIGQFMKGQVYGEVKASKTLLSPYVTIEQYGKNTLVHIGDRPGEDDVRMAQEGLENARMAMLSEIYSVVVFDEIATAFHFHLVTLQDMMEVVRKKPERVEIIFTGRYAPPELIEMADLVTEMKEIKHYYQKGVEAREGIER
jgi:cob(I)alamin adenosyltransferase